MPAPRTVSLAESLKALQALRDAAGLGPEQFPLPAFVGMISDEVEALRQQGRSDADIADMIQAASSIQISAAEIAAFYATSAERHTHED